jgi:hypothetical protein
MDELLHIGSRGHMSHLSSVRRHSLKAEDLSEDEVEQQSAGALLPSASNVGRDLSMNARSSFAAKNLRTSQSRVTIRRKLASVRIGTQRRRSQRVAQRWAAILRLLPTR